jgi:hypothetical protein
VKKLTTTVVAKSEAVSKDALSLLILGISVPTVNITELQTHVDNINTEVTIISYFTESVVSSISQVL